jgi:lipopolysaccharide transport system ATP-binding protein
MSDAAIRVENISKKYLLQHQVAGRSRYVALRDVLAHKAKSLFQKNRVDASREEFWALKDVSFDIKQGEAVGIIGRNGAGKSTLLKILSRITKPTKGRLEIEGRVASLLEVGTGFHPELTGRENIFLNGAILGMHRAEIKKKFDEIVAFAEVEKFLDTPVKRFSSGMYMRLAFAVAAHLEPEILIVDEVLAVGDAQFQHKCLQKMEGISQGAGRTVIFVSHNMEAIMRICSRCLVMQKGALVSAGDPAQQIKLYLNRLPSECKTIVLDKIPRVSWVRGNARLVSVQMSGNTGGDWSLEFGSPITFTAEINVERLLEQVEVTWAIFTQSGFEIASAWSGAVKPRMTFQPGRYAVRVTIPNLFLVPKSYNLQLGVHSSLGHEDWIPNIATFEVMTNPHSAASRADQIHATCIPEATYDFLQGTGSQAKAVI